MDKSHLESIARAYIAAVELEENTREQSSELAAKANLLRSDLHSLLMESLRENHIPFSDRFEATQIAYQLTANQHASI